MLRGARLVEARKDGPRVYYRLAEPERSTTPCEPSAALGSGVWRRSTPSSALISSPGTSWRHVPREELLRRAREGTVVVALLIGDAVASASLDFHGSEFP